MIETKFGENIKEFTALNENSENLQKVQSPSGGKDEMDPVTHLTHCEVPL